MRTRTFWLSRWLFLRLFGALYAVAFWVLVRQGLPLIGSDGLLPAAQYLREAAGALGGGRFLAVPTVFWLGSSDAVLHGAAWLGFLLSLVVAAGWANAPLLAALWLLYTSFVHVGQLFYGYGWEMMMVETGFLAIFLAPPWDARPFSSGDPPPTPILWLLGWELFRVMFGAGLIKLRGDACWRNLTCLDYHFETQPIPNPLSWYFHHLPHGVLHAGVLVNHFAELVAPWLALAPGPIGAAGGLVIAGFQGVLILSGNLSWLNWLTIALCLPCLDDRLLRRVLPRALAARFADVPAAPDRSLWRWRVRVAVTGVLLLLSVQPALNLLSPAQAMNASFDPIGLVNTYGAFGSVGKQRDEVVLEGAADAVPDASAHWREYELPCAPGDVQRRPCWASPYHYRLDWQMWFLPFSDVEHNPWLVHLAAKLLQGDPLTLTLFEENPFPGGRPRWVRAVEYRYRFTRPGEKGWWARERLGLYLPPVSLDSPGLKSFLAAYGWTR